MAIGIGEAGGIVSPLTTLAYGRFEISEKLD
jgi:hypothetical protein